MDKNLVFNALKTPDGTVIVSRSRWDMQCHLDASGKIYMVDGGMDYQRRSNHGDETDVSLFSDDPEAAKVVKWGTFGKNGDEPLKWLTIAEMTLEHLEAVVAHRNWKSLHPNMRDLIQHEIERRKHV